MSQTDTRAAEVTTTFSQPIRDNVLESISQIDGQIVIKVFGDDLDKLLGDAGNDSLYGGNAVDSLWGGNDNDRLFGGEDNDRLYGGTGNDRLDADAGNDRLYGDDGNDVVLGDPGIDRLFGDAGDDSLFGGNDTDSLTGGAGNDRLDGGAGNDIAAYGGFQADHLFDTRGLFLTVADRDHTDRLLNVERLQFADGLTTVVALDAGDNTLFVSGAGRQLVLGGGGNDDIVSAARDDVLLGETGDDRLFGAAGGQQLVGGDGNDELRGGGGADTLFGGAGRDNLEGRRLGEDGGSYRIAGEVLTFDENACDALYGGSGADAFFLLLNSSGSPTLVVVHDFEADIGIIATSSGAPAPTQTVVTSSPLGEGLLIQADNGDRAMFLVGVTTELPTVDPGLAVEAVFI